MKIQMNKKIADLGVKMIIGGDFRHLTNVDIDQWLNESVKLEVIDLKKKKSMGRYDIETFKLKFGSTKKKKVKEECPE